MTRNYTLIPA